MTNLCVCIFKLWGARRGGEYYDICSMTFRCVLSIKSSCFRLEIKVHCTNKKKKREKERKKENAKASSKPWQPLLLLFLACPASARLGQC